MCKARACKKEKPNKKLANLTIINLLLHKIDFGLFSKPWLKQSWGTNAITIVIVWLFLLFESLALFIFFFSPLPLSFTYLCLSLFLALKYIFLYIFTFYFLWYSSLFDSLPLQFSNILFSVLNTKSCTSSEIRPLPPFPGCQTYVPKSI